jgi:siroheme synthase-like protein
MAENAPTFPVSLVLSDRPCLIVGGGSVAARRLRTLLSAAALCTVVAPTVEEDIARSRATVCLRPYAQGEAADYDLVIAATGDASIDRAVAADARAAKVLVNVADDPAHSSFLMPAVARCGSISLAVSSDGTSPALSVWFRNELAGAVEKDAPFLAPILSDMRRALHVQGLTSEGYDWQGFIGDIREIRAERGDESARQYAARVIAQWLTFGRKGAT